MRRRGLLRMLMAGSGGALSLPLAACDEVGTSALAAWQGPPADFSDPRLRALAWALLAPSPHNTQPWLVDLRRADQVVLHVDLDRRLPIGDPSGRQTVIGQGTFLEALALAATGEGQATEITTFPDGPFPPDALDNRPVATVLFRPEPGLAVDPLATALPHRRSSKLAFDPEKPALLEHQAALANAIQGGSIEIAFADQPEQVMAIRELVREAVRAQHEEPAALEESVRWLRLCADTVTMHPDGVPVTGVLPWWMRRLGLLSPEQMARPGSIAWRAGRTFWDNLVSGSPSFGWLTTPDDSRRAQLAAGRAYLRVDLAAAKAGLAIHPVSHALGDRAAMQAHRAALERLLGVVPPRRVQMLFRLGYAGPQDESPRRPVEAILVS